MAKQRKWKQEVQTKPIDAPVVPHEAITEVLTPNLSSYGYLSESDLECLSELSPTGRTKDVFSLKLAKGLRVIERKQSGHGHKLVDIGTCFGNYGVHEPHPYFSARLGLDGLKVVNND